MVQAIFLQSCSSAYFWVVSQYKKGTKNILSRSLIHLRQFYILILWQLIATMVIWGEMQRNIL